MTTLKLVVCDDDPTLRAIVSKLAADAGHMVLAETDVATDAVEMVVRFGAEALILDLALPWGAGTRAVRELREAGAACEIVVFTEWAADSPEVRGAGVRAVIEKPDFESLKQVLAELAAGRAAETPAGADRRRPAEDRLDFPLAGSSTVSGLEHPLSFASAAGQLEEGDAVLVIHVGASDDASGWFARLSDVDRVLAAARVVRAVLRAQDRLSVDEGTDGELPGDLVVLVLGGGRDGVESVWHRLETAYEASGLPGVLSGGWALREPGVPAAAVAARARDGLASSIGRPAGYRLGAG